MKVKLGPYKSYFGPYQLAEQLKYLGFSENMQQVINKYMSRKGEKRNPEYLEGKPCKTCGTTTKISVYRIRPKQRDNIIYYKAVDIECDDGMCTRLGRNVSQPHAAHGRNHSRLHNGELR
jgi:hypothetical protein